MMINFKVSTGLAKSANRLLIDSNKLENVFYNIGNKFCINSSDFEEVDKILNRNFIKLYRLDTISSR